MYELIKINDRCYYTNSPSRIGLVLSGKNAALIDCGNNKDAGKRLLREADLIGVTPDRILLTHSHADHIGGARFLKEKLSLPVYSRGVERAFVESPILEPTLLFGAFPPDELRTRFLLADGVPCEELTDAALPEGVEAVSLPGHYFDMVGYRVGGVFYIGDAVASETVLEKYALSYIHDVSQYLATLDMLEGDGAELFVPSHSEPTGDIGPLVRKNREKIYEIRDLILSFTKEPIIFEDLLARMFSHYGLYMTHEQYALVGSTLRSYLAWISREGLMTSYVENNHLYWQAK